ncbi:hypothetical protein WMF30_02955 [Sorangium sp. So ce134]
MVTPDAPPGSPAAPAQSPPAGLVPVERPGFGAGLKAVLGGYGLALLSFLPRSLLIVLPAGILGAARLVVTLERWEATRRAQR